jgi:hypothetical protein
MLLKKIADYNKQATPPLDTKNKVPRLMYVQENDCFLLN